MKGKKRKLKRLNLAIRPEVYQQMETLVEQSSAESITELIRRAIRVYDFLINEIKSGSRIISKDQDGHEKEIVIL